MIRPSRASAKVATGTLKDDGVSTASDLFGGTMNDVVRGDGWKDDFKVAAFVHAWAFLIFGVAWIAYGALYAFPAGAGGGPVLNSTLVYANIPLLGGGSVAPGNVWRTGILVHWAIWGMLFGIWCGFIANAFYMTMRKAKKNAPYVKRMQDDDESQAASLSGLRSERLGLIAKSDEGIESAGMFIITDPVHALVESAAFSVLGIILLGIFGTHDAVAQVCLPFVIIFFRKQILDLDVWGNWYVSIWDKGTQKFLAKGEDYEHFDFKNVLHNSGKLVTMTVVYALACVIVIYWVALGAYVNLDSSKITTLMQAALGLYLLYFPMTFVVWGFTSVSEVCGGLMTDKVDAFDPSTVFQRLFWIAMVRTFVTWFIILYGSFEIGAAVNGRPTV